MTLWVVGPAIMKLFRCLDGVVCRVSGRAAPAFVAALFGAKEVDYVYYVSTFRK